MFARTAVLKTAQMPAAPKFTLRSKLQPGRVVLIRWITQAKRSLGIPSAVVGFSEMNDCPMAANVWDASNTCTSMSVPALSDFCIKTISVHSKFKSLEGLLEVYSKLDSGNPIYSSIRAHAIQRLSEQYLMLYERYGYEELKLVFAPEDLERFETERMQALEVKNRFASLKGTILEPIKIDCQKAADGTYPFDVLVQGAAWPSDVNPAKREEYLSDTEFASVFKMTKQEFNQKDKYVKIRLKKENRLF